MDLVPSTTLDRHESIVKEGRRREAAEEEGSTTTRRVQGIVEQQPLQPQVQPQQQQKQYYIQPTDTFQGICLQFGITATQLRRANRGFSGTNLFLAPNPLQIPCPPSPPPPATILLPGGVASYTNNNELGNRRDDDDSDTSNTTTTTTRTNIHHDINTSDDQGTTTTTSWKSKSSWAVMSLRRLYPELAETEARCYLELNDWDRSAAIPHYQRDLQWKEKDAGNPSGEVARFDTPIEYVIFDEDY